MIAVHALIIYSEIIEFDHSTICIIFSILKTYVYISFYAHAEFCRFL